MKKRTLSCFLAGPLFAACLCGPATSQVQQSASKPAQRLAETSSSMLRIVCSGTANNAEVSINGEFKGECPVDVQVAEGKVKVRVVKQIDALRERVFEQEVRMATGTVKRIEVELGQPQLTATAHQEQEQRAKEEEARVKEQMARQAQRAAEEKRLALERERNEAATRLAAQQSELRALAIVQSRANEGDVSSMLQLAAMLKKNSASVNQMQAASWYRKAAEAGSSEGMGELGDFYANGIGVDKVAAEHWWRKGAMSGDSRSMYGLSTLYAMAEGGLSENKKLALEWLLKSVEKGNTRAMTELGFHYQWGNIGLSRNNQEALNWTQKAVLLEEPFAMFRMGNAHMQGSMGLPKDDALAVHWFQKAAALGESTAMVMLASFYSVGRGGLAKNTADSLLWFEKAAELGNSIALKAMGQRYELGHGVVKDEKKALELYRKSAELGNAEGRASVQRLEAQVVR